MWRQVVVCLAVIVMGMVLGASTYNSVVDAPNWGRNIPQSLETAKLYFSVTNPGTFFRVASPIAQVLALLSLIACWKVPVARACAAAALAGTLMADVMTFAYFYPRNAIMFGHAATAEAAASAWREWSAMNHVRNAFELAALVAELMALTRVAVRQAGLPYP